MEIVYKALTRPAIKNGVPITPFFIACAIICLTSLYTNLIFLSLLPVVIFIMKEITKKDDLMRASCLGLELLFNLSFFGIFSKTHKIWLILVTHFVSKFSSCFSQICINKF